MISKLLNEIGSIRYWPHPFQARKIRFIPNGRGSLYQADVSPAKRPDAHGDADDRVDGRDNNQIEHFT